MKEPQTEQKVVKLNNPKKKRTTLVYAALAILIVGICIYQIFKINYSPVKTEVAFEKTISKTVSTQTFVVRDESYIRADAAGTLVPLVADGNRVARGDTVAVVFTSEESARNYAEMQSVQEDIDYFESLKNKVGAQTSDVDALDDRVYAACENYVRAIAEGNVDDYKSYEDAVCETITSRQLSTGTVIDPTEKIAALQAKLAELQAKSGGYTTIQVENPGYYISHVDGYETAIAYSDATSATADQIEALLSSEPTPDSELSGCMGRLVDSFNWYMLCVIDSESAAYLSDGGEVTVEFPLSSAQSVKAEVVSIQNAGNDRASVILRCNLMNQQYASLRKEQIRLVLQEFTG